ncbi:MAG: hypothetical protein ACI8QS_000959 [Planctomycetota bacterium]|jgi:hypothetical protein
MPQIYDCSCQLRIQTRDSRELHQLVSSFERLTDERGDIVSALFANTKEGERVDLMLKAEDVAAARNQAKSVLVEIEQFLSVRYGPGTVHTEAVLIREVDVNPTRRLGTPPDDGFSPNIQAELRRFRRHPIEGPDATIRETQTAGPDGTPSTLEILARLDAWRVFSKFDVVDVGTSNVTLHFQELPKQLHTFAEEVLLFCPEITDEVDDLDAMENASSLEIARVAVEGIAENLRREKTLRLWWD